MVRECDRAAELIDVAIYSDSGQCCFWHGALIIGAPSIVHPTYFKVLLVQAGENKVPVTRVHFRLLGEFCHRSNDKVDISS